MGETYRTSWSDGFPRNSIGMITGTSAYARLPDLPGSIFRLQAPAKNIGSFFIGMETGSYANQLVWELDSGYDTDWFKISGDNLNNLFVYNPSGSSERLAYWIQG
jgi:hypothetical protein